MQCRSQYKNLGYVLEISEITVYFQSEDKKPDYILLLPGEAHYV